MVDKAKDGDTEEYVSFAERFISTKFAPAVLSKRGRKAVLIFWTLLLGISVYAFTQVETDFSMELFIPEGSNTEKYLRLDMEYYETGFKTRIHTDNPDLDYSSEESQYRLLELYDKLKRCYLCDERWFVDNTLESWYLTFN